MCIIYLYESPENNVPELSSPLFAGIHIFKFCILIIPLYQLIIKLTLQNNAI